MSSLSVSLWLVQLAADFTEVALVWLVQSTLILLVALAAGRLLTSRGPALHSAIYRMALVVVMVCPVGTLLFSAWGQALGWRLPAIDVFAVDNHETDGETAAVTARTPGETRATPVRYADQSGGLHAEPGTGTSDLDRSPAGAVVDNAQRAAAPVSDAGLDLPLVTAADERASAIRDSSAVAEIDGAESAVRVRTGVSVAVVGLACLWLCTSLVLIGRLLAGLRASGRLVRQAAAAEADEQQICRQCAEAVGVRAPRLARSAFVDSPCLLGVVRPVILLPEGSLGVPLEAVLVHELAHLRRGDHVWNLAARSALCIGFVQPLLWLLVRRMETAAEEVCDDHVVHFGADRTRYADGLVTLAEQSALPLPGMSVPLVTLRSLLARRVRRILDSSRAPSLHIGRRGICAVVGIGLIVSGLAGLVGPMRSPNVSLASAAQRGKDAALDSAKTVARQDTRVKDNGPFKTNNRAPNATDEELPLPRGAIARLGTTRYRPGEDDLAVGFLPGDRTVVVTKSDGRLQHFDRETGRLIDQKRFSNPYFAAHTADGRFVAALGESSDAQRHKYTKWVALVDAKTGEEVVHHEFEGDPDLRLIAVAENASAIALQGKDAVLIDLANGNEIQWPMERIPYTSAVALSPDGNQLAVGSPGLVRVWKWRESKEPRLFVIPGKGLQRPTIGSIRFAPDGSQMAMGIHGEDVLLIDLTDGKEVRRFTAGDGIQWAAGDLDRLFFSADGRLLASPFWSRERSGVAVWEVASGKVVQRLNGGASTLAFSSDGNWVAGLRNFALLVWNVKSGELLGQSLPGHNTPPHTIRFIGGDSASVSTCENDAVHVWKIGVAKPEFVITHGPRSNDNWPDSIRAMNVSPDGKYLATSSMDDTVRLWDRNTGREIYKLPGHGRLGYRRFVRFSPDSKRLVSWADNMQICIWDIDTGKAIHEYRAQPSGEVLPKDGEVGDVPGAGGKFNAACGTISPDASRLAVVGKGVHIFDVAAGRELLKFDLPAQTRVRQIAISPDNQYLLLLLWGYGEQVPLPGGRIWRESIPRAQLRKLSTGELIAEVERQDQNTFDEGAAFSSDSRLVALTIGKGERSVVVMKVPDLTEVARIQGFDVAPFAFEFSPKGNMLAISHENTSVVVYDLEKLPAQ